MVGASESHINTDTGKNGLNDTPSAPANLINGTSPCAMIEARALGKHEPLRDF